MGHLVGPPKALRERRNQFAARKGANECRKCPLASEKSWRLPFAFPPCRGYITTTNSGIGTPRDTKGRGQCFVGRGA